MDLVALIPLLLEWVMLISIAAAATFSDNKWFYKNPTIGIVLWFTSFASAGVAIITALAIAFFSAFQTWLTKSSLTPTDNLWSVALTSFVPWLILGASGISLALVTQRMERFLEVTKQPNSRLLESIVPAFYHRSVAVVVVPSSEPLALSIGWGRRSDDARIIISEGLRDGLSALELAAVLDHEYCHLEKQHSVARIASRVIRFLSFRIITSRLLDREISLLLELAADKYSSMRNSKQAMIGVLSKISQEPIDRELRIRLAMLS